MLESVASTQTWIYARQLVSLAWTKEEVLVGRTPKMAAAITLTNLLTVVIWFGASVFDKALSNSWWFNGDVWRTLFLVLIRFHYFSDSLYCREFANRHRITALFFVNVFGLLWCSFLAIYYLFSTGFSVMVCTTIGLHCFATYPSFFTARGLADGTIHEELREPWNTEEREAKEMQAAQERSLRWDQDEEYERMVLQETIKKSQDAGMLDVEQGNVAFAGGFTDPNSQLTTPLAAEMVPLSPRHRNTTASEDNAFEPEGPGTASVRIRDFNGTVLSRRFNRTDSFEDVYAWVNRVAKRAGRTGDLQIVTSFPRTVIERSPETLAASGLLRHTERDTALTQILVLEAKSE